MKEPLKVGDWIVSISNLFHYMDGKLFHVVKVDRDVYYLGAGETSRFPNLLMLDNEGITWKRFELTPNPYPRGPKKKRCVCHSQDLFNFGCKCGGL